MTLSACPETAQAGIFLAKHIKKHIKQIRKGTIPLIHQYQLNGYNIVLDTYSGAIHVVDEIAARPSARQTCGNAMQRFKN